MIELLANAPWLLAIPIFLARIADVSMATVRTLLVFRGFRLGAALSGFVEVLIWIVAVGQVLSHLDRWYLVFAYSAGFSAGNVVGMWLEARLAMGDALVRVVSRDPRIDLAATLRRSGREVIELSGRDGGTPVEVLLVFEARRRMRDLLELVRRTDCEAVCTTSDVRQHRTPVRARRVGPLLWSKRK